MRYCLTLLLAFLTAFAANAQITGSANVCVSSSTALSCSPTGGTWSSANPSIATVNVATGLVTGAAAGTALISYEVASTVYTRVVTVNPLPGPITTSGPFTVCEGGNRSFSCTPPGGIWSSVETGVASADPSSGLVSGLAAGTSTIHYILSTTCSSSAVVTVNAAPTPVLGSSSLCVNGNTTLADLTINGTWISSNSSLATIGSSSGAVNGIAAGAVTMSYVLTTTGCVRTHNMTVNPLPSAISGPASICAGSFASLGSSPSGGTWSSSTPAVASVHSVTGVASGSIAGTARITYTLPTTCAVSRVQTVTAMPSAITGPAIVCVGAGITLSNSVPGGTWSVGTPSVAAIFPSGTSTTVMGVAAGTANITYSTGTSCQAVTTITVNPLPTAATVSGPSIVCVASAITLSSSISGGTWFSPSSLVNVGAGGVITGISTGTATITYAVSNSCGTANTPYSVTVSVPPSVITGPTVMCAGTTNVLVNSVPGGLWSSSSTSIATVGMGTGLVTGIAGGTATITYAISPGCQSTAVVTVNSAPSAISGPDNVCVGSFISLTNTASGGIWTSSTPSIAVVGVIGTTVGGVLGVAPGTTIITYAIGSCNAYKFVTVNGLPSVTATAMADACGGKYTISATGGASYSWSPATGIACPVCATTSLTPAASITYTVTGTNTYGCNSTDTIQINGNRIYGHISFTAATPAVPDLKVWLIQYNPADSSVIAADSVLTCLDGGAPFFEFSNKVPGTYQVKAKLLSSIAGTSDYIPTYGSSASSWFDAAAITHSSASDVQNINMLFGTVPAGPGFISGNVYSGAGRGTSGDIPEVGMLIFLKDAATGRVLTYTYTNEAGYYSFTGIGAGNYIICPEEMGYFTTSSAPVSISEATIAATGVSFKKHTVQHTIYPYSSTGSSLVGGVSGSVNLYPNPANGILNIQSGSLKGAATITITDVAGRILLTLPVTLSQSATPVDVSALNSGLYLINIATADGAYSGKFTVAHN